MDQRLNVPMSRRDLLARVVRASSVLVVGQFLPAGLLSGCVPVAPVKDTVVVAHGSPGTQLDPHQLTETQSALRHCYETLVDNDDDMKLYAKLATSWEPVDPTTWKFVLRQGVKFHNGEKFNAEAVKLSLERIVNPDTKSAQFTYLSPVQKVDIVDEYTVLVRTSTPFGALVKNLTYTGAILPPSYAKLDAAAIAQKAIGTGPWKLIEFKKGEQWSFEANPDYWGPKGNAKKLIFKEVREPSTRVAMLRSGEADLIGGITPDQEAELAKDPNIVISKKGGVSTRYLLFNNSRKPFDDKRVRLAINLAIDTAAICNTILKGRSVPVIAPLGPAVFGHNPNLKPYGYDPERAKKLLAEAGYANGFTITLLYFAGNLNPAEDQVAQAVTDYLAKVGIKVVLDAKEVQTVVPFLTSHNYDFNQAAWMPASADADLGLYVPYRSVPDGNRAFYKNAEVDRLLDEGRAETDQSKREKLYMRAQELLWEDVPYAWMFNDMECLAMRKNLKNVSARPDTRVALYAPNLE